MATEIPLPPDEIDAADAERRAHGGFRGGLSYRIREIELPKDEIDYADAERRRRASSQ